MTTRLTGGHNFVLDTEGAVLEWRGIIFLPFFGKAIREVESLTHKR